jgi:hypothetical protein
VVESNTVYYQYKDGEFDGVKHDVIYSCLLFIVCELFPSYGSWRYIQISQKYVIGNF